MDSSILFVDDECGEDFSYFLEREGHLVIVCENGRDAFNKISDGLRYQLAIVDLSLPEVAGDSVIEISKRINPQIPVISFSGYNAKPNGSDRHVVKPIMPDNLVKIVNSYLLR